MAADDRALTRYRREHVGFVFQFYNLIPSLTARENVELVTEANALAPSSIRTASNVQSMGDAVHYVERQQVADAVLFLCSEQASAITGTVMPLG